MTRPNFYLIFLLQTGSFLTRIDFRIEQRDGGEEEKRERWHAKRCSTSSSFSLVEVVRRTIGARMWSIVSSHRTTCMTHFRVHVYRLTWNIYSTANRVQPNPPPFRQPFADLPADRPRHPRLLFPPTLSLVIFRNIYIFVVPIVNRPLRALLRKFSPSTLRFLVIFSSLVKFLAGWMDGFSWKIRVSGEE